MAFDTSPHSMRNNELYARQFNHGTAHPPQNPAHTYGSHMYELYPNMASSSTVASHTHPSAPPAYMQTSSHQQNAPSNVNVPYASQSPPSSSSTPPSMPFSDQKLPSVQETDHLSNLTNSSKMMPNNRPFIASPTYPPASYSPMTQPEQKFDSAVNSANFHNIDDQTPKADFPFGYFLLGVLLGAVTGPFALCALHLQERFGCIRKRKIFYAWGVVLGLSITLTVVFVLWHILVRMRKAV